MPPKKPINDKKRTAILRDVKAGGKSRAQIARDHGVSADSVGRIAKTAEIANPFVRTMTEKATRAKQADNKSRRATLASNALDDADVMRQRALASEAGRDARDFATAYGIFIDKHAVLERLDTDNGAEDAKSMIGELASALQAVAEQLPADES